MKNIDLQPHNYRKKDRRGHWYTPDDPKVLWFSLACGLGLLAYAFWHRDEVPATALFWFTALISFATGGTVFLLIRHYGID